MQEKRNHLRRFTALNIDCYNAEGTCAVDTCLLVNISKGGVAIESKKALHPGEKLLVKFVAPDGKQYYILTEILHSSLGGFGNLYGAKYCEPDKKNFKIFSDYLLEHFNLY